MKSLVRCSQILGQLKAGSRAWFWLCSEMPIDKTRLLVTPFSKDPLGERLQKQVAELGTSGDVLASTGVVDIGIDGIYRFGSLHARLSHLVSLAEWVKQHVEKHPNLAVLKNAELVSVSGQGKVTESFRSDRIWNLIPQRIVKGSIGHMANRLEAIPPNQEGWFWMTDRGPGRLPFLLVYPCFKDPDCEIFMREYNELSMQSESPGFQQRGILRNDKNYGICFISQGKSENWADIIQALTEKFGDEYPVIGNLENSCLVRMKQNKVKDRITYGMEVGAIPD